MVEGEASCLGRLPTSAMVERSRRSTSCGPSPTTTASRSTRTTSASTARHFPPWLAVDAEEAWTRNAFEEVEVSSGHREVADALEYLGIGHEMECLTDDEYFSLDLYVPEHDCAIEVDGPTHFVDEIVVRPGGDVGRVARRTTATELRDMFLRKRHGRVVTMPWFELDECDTREERAAYVG